MIVESSGTVEGSTPMTYGDLSLNWIDGQVTELGCEIWGLTQGARERICPLGLGLGGGIPMESLQQ